MDHSKANPLLDSLQRSNLRLLHRVDSLQHTINNLSISNSHFEAILNHQMMWFCALFIIAFILLGVAYYLGIFKYLQNSITSLNQVVTTSREDINHRIKDVQGNLNAVIENKKSSFNEQMAALKVSYEEALKDNASQMNTLIASQKQEYDKDRKKVIADMKSIEFNASRAMYFYNYNSREYYNALSWLTILLRLLIVDEVFESKEDWIYNLEDLVKKLFYKEGDAQYAKYTIRELEKTITFEKDLAYSGRITDCIRKVKATYKIEV